MDITSADVAPLVALLDLAAHNGAPVVAVSISGGGALSLQVRGYHRPEGVADVDSLAGRLDLDDDNGEPNGNYTRRGWAELAGRHVAVTVYTTLSDQCRCGLCSSPRASV